MLNLGGHSRIQLTTGTVTGSLAIPPYVTMDPPILKLIRNMAHYDKLFSSCQHIRCTQIIQHPHCRWRRSSVALLPPTPFNASLGFGQVLERKENIITAGLYLFTDKKKHMIISFKLSLEAQTLNSSFISGRLSASSLITWLAPMAFSLLLSCENSGLWKGRHNEEVHYSHIFYTKKTLSDTLGQKDYYLTVRWTSATGS